MVSCMALDPTERPSFQYIKDFFTELYDGLESNQAVKDNGSRPYARIANHCAEDPPPAYENASHLYAESEEERRHQKPEIDKYVNEGRMPAETGGSLLSSQFVLSTPPTSSSSDGCFNT